jgi:hypothetical protein
VRATGNPSTHLHLWVLSPSHGARRVGPEPLEPPCVRLTVCAVCVRVQSEQEKALLGLVVVGVVLRARRRRVARHTGPTLPCPSAPAAAAAAAAPAGSHCPTPLPVPPRALSVIGASGDVGGRGQGVCSGWPDLVGNTPMVRVASLSAATGCTVLAKAEFMNPGGTSKDRVAVQIVRDAAAAGRLPPGGTIVEGTSGSTGISLAYMARACGYACRIYMPDDQVCVGVLMRGACVMWRRAVLRCAVMWRPAVVCRGLPCHRAC